MTPDDYTITTDKTRFDIAAIHAFLSRSCWPPGVPLTIVERAIANALAGPQAPEAT